MKKNGEIFILKNTIKELQLEANNLQKELRNGQKNKEKLLGEIKLKERKKKFNNDNINLLYKTIDQYNEDEHYSSKFYAKIGGVSLAEIINLEYSFLSLINFNLFVNEDLFNKYNDYLLSSDSDDDDSDNYNYEGSNDEENNCNKF